MKIEVMDEVRKAFDPIATAFVVRQTLVRVPPPFITLPETESNIHFMHKEKILFSAVNEILVSPQ